MNHDDFRAGAREMFDCLMNRAANNYHGRPEMNKICEEENKLIQAWAIDALEEISPEDHFQWKAICDPTGLIKRVQDAILAYDQGTLTAIEAINLIKEKK